jgi:hypothetical protein
VGGEINCLEVIKLYEKKIDEKVIGINNTINARLDGMDEAVKTKTTELDRRLAELNQLRAEVTLDRTQFVLRETYDDKIRDLDIWKEKVDSDRTILMTQYGNRITVATVISVLSLIVSVLTIVAIIFVGSSSYGVHDTLTKGHHKTTIEEVK